MVPGPAARRRGPAPVPREPSCREASASVFSCSSVPTEGLAAPAAVPFARAPEARARARSRTRTEGSSQQLLRGSVYATQCAIRRRGADVAFFGRGRYIAPAMRALLPDFLFSGGRL